MQKLDAPDLCAHVDRLRVLCDRLEHVQDDPKQYRDLVARIRAEADALRETVCRVAVEPTERSPISSNRTR